MVLILAGDLHLGRSSSRVPDRVRREEIRASAAWRRIVDLAIRERAVAVCLSGDIVDQENRFWEAVGPLEQGVQRLSSSGIRTVAVAGNHDFDVLARLADQFPPEDFVLLGKRGTWERFTLELSGQEVLHIDGWSFPKARVPVSPLDSYRLPRDVSVPTLGLVHGDLDASSSPYAPLDLVRLQGLGPSGWLLGHVHAPRLATHPGLPWVLYPGSPQALDPGESGVHGPWICRVTPQGLGIPEQAPLSSVSYAGLTVDLEGITDEPDLQARLLDRIRDEVERTVRSSGSELSCVTLRLRLVGRTSVSAQLSEMVERIREDLVMSVEDVTVVLEKVDVETLPAIDLEEYARSSSAPGALARLILDLEGEEPSEDAGNLIRLTRRRIEEQDRQKDFSLLERAPVTEDLARQYLLSQARGLLTRLLSQSP
jgi:DNA repair exonuclease SbcCD nuclease subunit